MSVGAAAVLAGASGCAVVPRYHPLQPALPMIGLGSAEAPDREAMAAAVVAACKSGVKLIDTAQNYGSEAAVGEGLRHSGEEATTSMFTLCKVDLATAAFEDPAERMRRQVLSTCSNLGVSKISAAVIHWPICLDASANEGETKAVRKAAWQELERLHDEGIVGCLGVSNWTPCLLDELIEFARVPPTLNEIELSPACGRAQLEVVAECQSRGVACVAYSPYGRCWLAKYFSDFVPWGVTDLTQNSIVKAVAAEIGCDASTVLLRWALQQNVAVIPKSLQAERVAQSMLALKDEFSLSDEQISRLMGLADERRGVEASIDAHQRIIASPGYKWQPT